MTFERASTEDMTSLATDTGSAPMQVGAIILIDAPTGFDLATGVDAIAERILAVPRLRQRLTPVPFGCGRPVWTDDSKFTIERHVRTVECPGAGDEAALLELAARCVSEPLPRDRPLWSATFVSALTGNQTALVVVFHHVLADGIGGLAVLANLVDGPRHGDPVRFPRPAPSIIDLGRDALRERLRALASLPETARRLCDAATELRSTRPTRPPRSSLNQPTGPDRYLTVIRADLAEILSVAHAHGATVNDVVLTAIASALHDLMATRGERVDRFVVSVPVAARSTTTATELGNRVGIVPIDIPATGDPYDRLEAIVATTRHAKNVSRGASTALLGPLFRLLAFLRIFDWAINRQHLVNAFATNLRGPDTPMAFLDAPITDVIPITVVTGNVPLAFAVLSYAGTLTITLIADPAVCPHRETLTQSLEDHLDHLADPLRGSTRSSLWSRTAFDIRAEHALFDGESGFSAACRRRNGYWPAAIVNSRCVTENHRPHLRAGGRG